MAKVIPLNNVTTLDLSVKNVLSVIPSLDTVIIAGWTTDGGEYFASSVEDGGTILWLLERMKKVLMDKAEELSVA